MADMQQLLNPGPVEDDLLYLQQHHLSQKLWEDDINRIDWTIRTRAHPLWGHEQGPPIPDSVLSWFHKWGLSGVVRCGTMHLDRHLITALLERWRRETHSFHFRTGEATVTLEDVSVLWHLPVDGDAITGEGADEDIGRGPAAASLFVHRLLGWDPPSSAFRHRAIMIKDLRRFCIKNIALADEQESHGVQYARALALLLMGTVLFPDISGCRISLKYLWLLRDPTRVKQYSWGSAVLAHLYRELCSASITSKPRKEIGGALTLLQTWAWMRMSSLSPRTYSLAVNQEARVLSDGTVLPVAPFASIVSSTTRAWGTSASHNLRILRDTLDSDTTFRWRLYPREAYNHLVGEGVRDMLRYNGPIFCLDIVEFHWASRVMRQYGMLQGIPQNPDRELDCVHNPEMGKKDWARLTTNWLRIWSNRHTTISTTAETHVPECEPDYNAWYDRHTRRFISQPCRYVRQGYQPGNYGLLASVQSGLRADPAKLPIYKPLIDRIDTFLWRGHQSGDTGLFSPLIQSSEGVSQTPSPCIDSSPPTSDDVTPIASGDTRLFSPLMQSSQGVSQMPSPCIDSSPPTSNDVTPIASGDTKLFSPLMQSSQGVSQTPSPCIDSSPPTSDHI